MVVDMINSIGVNYYQNMYVPSLKSMEKSPAVLKNQVNFTSAPANNSSSAAAQPTIIRTRLNSQEEKLYKTLQKELDKTSRKQLESLLKRGILLNSNSYNKTSVLDNLYKIATTQRAQGLDNKNILKSTIEILDNPFKSTQTFGDIPQEFKEKAIQTELKGSTNLVDRLKAEKAINVELSGSCPAASIEFSMAQKSPAEFTRFVEGLSSVNMSVDKGIKLSNLADNTLDAVWLLNAFEIPYEIKDYDNVELKFAPDKNALLRAQIQTKYQNGNERSVVDVLMQSTFMNVGSQQTYDSLTDKRAGKFSDQDTGLIEFEKTFTESVVDDKNKITITNQKINDNGFLAGYESDFGTFKRQILDTLKAGENIIIGYTFTDDTNKIVGGHEITIVGARQDKDGKTYFICNDSDDDYFGPIEYPEDYLLPKIHHATFPKFIVEKDVKFEDNWKEGLRSYREMKQSA